jgi:membrane protein implicated in regulation of membrane protease activity
MLNLFSLNPEFGANMSALVNYFAQHLDYVFFILAGLCTLVELVWLKFRGPFIFPAIGALITGLFICLGLITQFSVAVVIFIGFSVACGGLLWGSLGEESQESFDADSVEEAPGTIVLASTPISTHDGSVFFAHSEYPARLDNTHHATIAAGSTVIVTRVDGPVLLVREV